jgi:hypothetical protein
MAQKPKVITVTVTTAGTEVRCITDPKSAYRYVPSAYFEALSTNTGNIFVGDSSVTSTNYSTLLEAKQGSLWNGDEVRELGGPMKNLIDLYHVWVDASVNGEKVLVTISEQA